MKKLVISFIVLIVFSANLSAQNLSMTDDKLPFSAGFKSVLLSDKTRPFRLKNQSTPTARPIRLFVWYPTAKTKRAEFLRFADYVYASNLTKSADQLTAEEKGELQKKLVATLDFFEISAEQTDLLMTALTGAVANAPEPKTRFPLIVLGNVGDGFHLTATAEFLAANGFVVVGLPSLGANEDERCGFDLNCLRLQQTDLEYAIDKMRSFKNVDSSKIGLLAWSFSGLAVAQISMKNAQIKAVVSLDAATGYQYGKDLLDQSKEFDINKTKVPFLHFHGLGGQSRVAKNFDFFNAYRSTEKRLVAFRNLQHADFASLYGLGVRYAKKETAVKVFEGIRWTNLLTWHFFNARLKNDRKSQKFLNDSLKNEDSNAADIFSFSTSYKN